MKTLIKILCLILILLSFTFNKDKEDAIGLTTGYYSIGSSLETGLNKNNETPWSLGVTYGLFQEIDNLSFGFDMSFEGTSLSSLYGQNDVPIQSLSLNLTIIKHINGGQLYNTNGDLSSNSKWRTDLGILIGFIETETYCTNGDSYLGYACYADATPTGNYKTNFGGLFIISYQSLSFGIRLTEVSQQFMLGYNFNYMD